ncbi:MAG: hypothetical protein ACI9EF_001617 [Pseudohongiellaceae bacterium]|jgi:hypothetical protein
MQIEHPHHVTTRSGSCASCGVGLFGKAAFWIRSRQHRLQKCGRCSLIDRALLGRSARVALIVGLALVALNQGDALLAGTFPWASAWFKLPLTYMVPFCVATYGALANGFEPVAISTTEGPAEARQRS